VRRRGFSRMHVKISSRANTTAMGDGAGRTGAQLWRHDDWKGLAMIDLGSAS
jgi:hypothetical protein